jgi:DHA1 family bicyclomycin/chloramphenicol resistance-like MFS transporter
MLVSYGPQGVADSLNCFDGLMSHASPPPSFSVRPSESRFPTWLLVCSALIAIGPLSIDMYLPAFPSMGVALGATSGQIELTLGAFLIGLALGQAFYGPMSDRFGRKPPLYFGLTLYGLASLGCALAPTVEWLMVCRTLQALGGCVGMVISRAAVRDRLDGPSAARAFSTQMLVMGMAPILAPLLGSAILTVADWHAIFFVLAGLSVILLFAVHTWLDETVDTVNAPRLALSRVLRSYGELLRSPRFVGYSLCAGFVQAGMFAYIAGSPFVLIQLYGIPPHWFSVIFGLNALGLIVMSQVNSVLMRRHTPETVLRIVTRIPALSALTVAAIAASGHLSLAVLLIGFFCHLAMLGCIMPNASAMALSQQGHRAGTASALMGTLQFSLGTMAGLAIGLLSGESALPLISIMAVCSVASFCMGIIGRRAKH